jgi:7-cyano-7-deazaguanine synthase
MPNKTRKAFVLLSGGLDSSTCLYKAIYDFAVDTKEEVERRIRWNVNSADPHNALWDPITWVEAVSINYGQRHSKEINQARKICADIGVEHRTIKVGNIMTDKNTMLTQKDIEIPNASYGDLPKGVSPTYVPFRNGTMLAILTAHAQKWVNEQNKTHAAEDVEAGVYFGAHAEDAHNWAYPDCTPEFIGAMSNAIYIGSYMQIRLHAPLMHAMKSDIVTLGAELDVPFEDTWSCYAGGIFHCGTCPTCRSRMGAFADAGIPDPTVYASGANTKPIDSDAPPF